ncbi:hypothetical protein Tco_0494698 [Tanacetum coccineum]
MTGGSESNVDSISSLDVGNPLHLQTNDNNSGPLINLKLTGSENYRVWSNAMKIALQARNKMCFVDETFTNISDDLYLSQVYSENAAEFLMRLDDVYLPIRSSLLTQTELPDVKDNFVIVYREESNKGLGCFEIIGYPNGFKRNQNGKNSSNIKGYSSNNVDVQKNSSGMPFISDQIAKLMSLIGDKPSNGIDMMSTSAFVDPESSTQADGDQSSQVPVPLPEDPYKAIRTVRMAVRVPLAMSSVLSASMAEVAAMSESVFRKRFRSSYESSPSSSPPDLPSRKHYRGTSELVEDSEEDEVEEIEESLDSDSVSEDAEDGGPTAEDDDPAVGDEGLAAGSRAPSDGLGLEEEEEAVPGGQQQAALVVGTSGSRSAPESERPERVSASRQPTLTTWTNPEDGMVYIDVPAYPPPVAPVQTPPSPDMIRGAIACSYEQERVVVTFGAIWRPVLALESWAGQTDAQRAALWHVISDMQGENRDLRLQLAEERRARLELAEVVDSMRRGQEPRGDA